ncbi:MAG: hypothetical protein K8S54_20225 [Spirochaetia bacterium]|nr:hypothetical protein [Spirochaetia bacterium]
MILEQLRKRSAIALCILLFVYAFSEAIRLRWTADDAFISFRYAESFSAGHGLTFNVGEKVEGFTNFLWTILLVPFAALGVNLEIVSWILSIFCYLLLLLVLLRRSLIAATLPVALAGAALHRHLHIFSTSGLETALFTLLITAGVLEFFDKRSDGLLYDPDGPLHRQKRGFIMLGIAILVRPDGALIYGLSAIFWLVDSIRNGRSVIQGLTPHLIPFCIVFPIWLVKALYYGSPLPNTFFAKSAASPYFSQGLRYAAMFFQSYWVLGIGLLFSLVTLADRRKSSVLFFGLIGFWLLYVIYIGGDFMFARFIVPVIPLMFVLIEDAIGMLENNSTPQTIAAVLLCAGLVFRYDPFSKIPMRDGIFEESKIYTRAARTELKTIALSIKPTLIRANPTIAFVGAQAALAYYWFPLTAIEAETGLTDKTIARTPLEKRGKVGHEKQASIAYLRERKVNLLLRPSTEPGLHTMHISGIPGDITIVDFNPTIIQSLLSDSRFRLVQ